MTNEDSGILANLFRNVKIYRGLKFYGKIPCCFSGMSGEQLLNEFFHLRLNQRKDEIGRFLVNIVDIPIPDPVGPTGKLFLHHGPVFLFEHGNDKRGVDQIVFPDSQGIRTGEGCRDQGGGKSP